MGVPFIDKQFHQAREHQMAGRFVEAERIYQKILANQPNHAEATHFLGLLTYQMGRPADAVPIMQRAIALDPKRSHFYNNLGEVFRVLGADRDAVMCFHRAIELNPRKAEAYNNIAIVHSNRRRFAEAIPWSRKALEMQRDFVTAMYTLAQSLYESGNSGEASGWLARIIEREPNHGEARYLLACISGRELPATAPPSYVARLFNNYADNFDQHLVNELQYHVPEMLRQTIDRLEPNRPLDILDLGCGTGLMGVAFRSRAKSIAGVDLAPAMIAKSKARGVYDALEVGDVTTFLTARLSQADLVTAGDVFVYIGDLKQIFEATARALRPRGMFAFSVEGADGDGFVLRRSRRYAHSRAYLERLAAENALDVISVENVMIRRGEEGVPIGGMNVVLRKQDLPA